MSKHAAIKSEEIKTGVTKVLAIEDIEHFGADSLLSAMMRVAIEYSCRSPHDFQCLPETVIQIRTLNWLR